MPTYGTVTRRAGLPVGNLFGSRVGPGIVRVGPGPYFLHRDPQLVCPVWRAFAVLGSASVAKVGFSMDGGF